MRQRHGLFNEIVAFKENRISRIAYHIYHIVYNANLRHPLNDALF